MIPNVQGGNRDGPMPVQSSPRIFWTAFFFDVARVGPAQGEMREFSQLSARIFGSR